MNLMITHEWLERKLAETEENEPTGLLAVSPELLLQVEAKAGRKWDGSQADAEALVFGFLGLSTRPTGN